MKADKEVRVTEIMLEKVKRSLLCMQRYPWEHGTAMQAFLEAGDMEIVTAMAAEAAYRRIEDGRVAQIGDTFSVTDPCCAGEGLLAAYRETGDPELKNAFDGLLKWAMEGAPRNAQGVVYHRADAPQFWSDSMYMLPPFLAVAGEYDACLHQIRGYLAALMDPETHLMRHMWDDEKKCFVRSALWGTGSGWTAAGLARVIALLPETYEKERREMIKIAREILDGMLRYVRDDGLFYDVLDDPGSFPETNTGQMAAYTIFRGMAEGWLPEEYLEAAQKMRRAAMRKVDAYGRVQGACGAPTFDKSGSSPEANAFFILMESAAHRYGAEDMKEIQREMQ